MLSSHTVEYHSVIKRNSILTSYNMEEYLKIMLSGRSQSQTITYYIIPFILNSQNTEIHKDRKQISDCSELESGEGENRKMIAKEYRVSV